MTSINEALSSVAQDKAEYFKWKFPDVRFDQMAKVRTEEEFLQLVNKKSLNAYKRWERTAEYKALVALYLQSKTANDLNDIYKVVSEKAKKGDEKSVRLFLQLNKEIVEHAKMALKELDSHASDDVADGLIV